MAHNGDQHCVMSMLCNWHFFLKNNVISQISTKNVMRKVFIFFLQSNITFLIIMLLPKISTVFPLNTQFNWFSGKIIEQNVHVSIKCKKIANRQNGYVVQKHEHFLAIVFPVTLKSYAIGYNQVILSSIMCHAV